MFHRKFCFTCYIYITRNIIFMENFLPSGVSQNVAWTFQRGSFISHILITFLVNILYAQLFSRNLSYQLTILTYNMATFIFFHCIIGDPFDSRYVTHTFWEQMVEQLDNTETVWFLGLFPVILFILGNHLVKWNNTMFILCFISLCMVMIPKLGFMHRRRIISSKEHKKNKNE
ncbi:ORM1-like protein [Spraguea lophii 42_110]|uniref:ORM1-like protein n=1 Tax=Spraguea lophii (strain 42_110) TaxID=1358809 RepID=S7XQ54_SPRLO|nr:ORM1-like protein [Spraguea lophii 42_110]